jgi:oligopeptide/dipeptide ABC transporter ATP-binding protein
MASLKDWASAITPWFEIGMVDHLHSASGALLEVEDLRVEFLTPRGSLVANRSISFSVAAGETLGIVGESGSGKSVLCRAILRLLPSPPAHQTAKRIAFLGRDLMQISEKEMQEVRGQDIGMVFQNPMTSLNPVWTVGDQISEGLRVHKRLGHAEARGAAIRLLRQVGIPSPEIRVDDYPYRWSGGMIQRAVIAMAMAGSPKLLLADEPTTALDVTIQDQILSLLMELQRATNMSLVLVSHDMGVIAETSDRLMVLYAGQIVEIGRTQEIFKNPAHPYTQGLLRSIPNVGDKEHQLTPIRGQPPDLARLGGGCPFAPRCDHVSADCRAADLRLAEVESEHMTACLHPERIRLSETLVDLKQ